MRGISYNQQQDRGDAPRKRVLPIFPRLAWRTPGGIPREMPRRGLPLLDQHPGSYARPKRSLILSPINGIFF